MGFLDRLNKISEHLSSGINPASDHISTHTTDGRRKQSVDITTISGNKRELDFSRFLTPEMKARQKNGELEWMDLVEVFEGMYMGTCEGEGRILVKGGRNSDDRFKVLWEVDGMHVQGEYVFDDRWWIVTETLKKKKNA
jgi:hypothetical protein